MCSKVTPVLRRRGPELACGLVCWSIPRSVPWPFRPLGVVGGKVTVHWFSFLVKLNQWIVTASLASVLVWVGRIEIGGVSPPPFQEKNVVVTSAWFCLSCRHTGCMLALRNDE